MNCTCKSLPKIIYPEKNVVFIQRTEKISEHLVKMTDYEIENSISSENLIQISDQVGHMSHNCQVQMEMEGHPSSIRFRFKNINIKILILILNWVFIDVIFLLIAESRLEVPRTCCALLNAGVRGFSQS